MAALGGGGEEHVVKDVESVGLGVGSDELNGLGEFFAIGGVQFVEATVTGERPKRAATIGTDRADDGGGERTFGAEGVIVIEPNIGGCGVVPMLLPEDLAFDRINGVEVVGNALDDGDLLVAR